MRQLVHGTVLSVRAIAGLHVVTLAWDFAAGQDVKRKGLLGFAIERSKLTPSGTVEDQHFIEGIKRFKDEDAGLAPGTPVPTSEHPIQSFQWGDYTVDPGVTYRFRVVPVYGTPEVVKPDDASATTVEVTTEKEQGVEAGGPARHDIFFNRGVAGSQAYARLFGKKKPDENKPKSKQMKWLSRGLFEALVAFIGRAAGADAADYKLRAMLYEFRYAPVGEAFKAAADAGANVRIFYEAQSYKAANTAMIKTAKIAGLCTPQKSRAGVRHNKFIVLIHKDIPIAVWTGSTNISAGGIFGHSNVGHSVWNRAIATKYLEYWEALAEPDVTTAKLRARNQGAEKTPANGTKPPKDRILTLFSARDPEDPRTSTPTLSWYGSLLKSATRISCMTFAFNFDPVFQQAIQGDTDSLNYLVFDKTLDNVTETEVRQNKNTIIAVGGKLESGDMELFLGEQLTGFNTNRYIHDKILLVDPLTDDPIVVTGTANFSEASQDKNDENMLVIRGNTRVADIYFGEFMRIFDHHYSRYIIAKLKAEGRADPNAGFLKVKTSDWLDSHFRPGQKELRRRFFMDET